MSTITIDNVEYEESSLSEEAKSELMSLQVCDQKISVLQTDLAITQTARNAYATALNGMLPQAKAKAKTKKD